MHNTVVLQESIVCVKVNTIILPIRPDHLTVPGPDWIVRSVAGEMYHNQIHDPITYGQIVTRGNSRFHRGGFDNVIFVVDDGETSLFQLVRNALNEARCQHIDQVALPLLRYALASYEQSRDNQVREIGQETLRGLQLFWKEALTYDMDILVCIPEPDLYKAFRRWRTDFEYRNLKYSL
jgi:hypothetical protein